MVSRTLGNSSGPGEAAGALREPRLLDAAGVAEVDHVDAGIERRRDERRPVLLGIVGRELDDDRLPGCLPHQPEQRAHLLRRSRQLVDEPRVRRRDVELDEVCVGLEGLHQPPVLLGGLSGDAEDERAVVTQPEIIPAEGLKPGVLEPVAVHEPWPRRRRHANQLGSGWPGLGPSVMLFAVTAPKPSAMARRRIRGS
jgi:hypothetical protein